MSKFTRVVWNICSLIFSLFLHIPGIQDRQLWRVYKVWSRKFYRLPYLLKIPCRLLEYILKFIASLLVLLLSFYYTSKWSWTRLSIVSLSDRLSVRLSVESAAGMSCPQKFCRFKLNLPKLELNALHLLETE